jgi:hypothetical protein
MGVLGVLEELAMATGFGDTSLGSLTGSGLLNGEGYGSQMGGGLNRQSAGTHQHGVDPSRAG